MFNNDNITLFNAYSEDGLVKYKRTYIYGVDWQDKQSVTVTDKGLLSADSVKIFIPYESDFEGKQYMKPKAFNLGDKDMSFTFNNGDIVARGILDFDITGIKPNTVKYLEEQYDDVVKIISIMDCELTGNWEVGAK